MPFGFPKVSEVCPLCSASRCARWKGYFVREFFCRFLDYVGPIAIHVGHCHSTHCDFSYFPSFLLPGRSPSRATLETFANAAKLSGNTSQSIGVLSEGLSDTDFSVSSSTAYSWMYAICLCLCINQLELGLPGPVIKSVYSTYELSSKVLASFFDRFCCRWNVHQSIVFYPP